MSAQRVERPSEVERVSQVLQSPAQQLSICTITGPGGVGKSHLIRHVLGRVAPKDHRYLQLSADASRPEHRRDLFAVLGQLFPRGLPMPAKPNLDYFPHLRKVAAAHVQLLDAAAAELRNAKAEVRETIASLLKLGRSVNDLVPISKKYVDLEGLPTEPAEIDRVLREAQLATTRLRAFAETSFPLRLLPQFALADRVKRDLHGAIADALRTDLSAALTRYEAGDTAKVTNAKILGIDRLLIVVDDYEALAPVLQDFLIGALIPRLADAPFQTVIVISSRDELDAMSPSWLQHCDRFLVERVRVKPFSRDEALDLIRSAGIASDRAEEIHRATGGFPFLVALAIEEHTEEAGGAALYLRKFYDRTTRWMSDTERRWFVGTCYLDAVNEDTLLQMFPDERTSAIQDWFESEPSIRDPSGATFRVRPLIREKVLRYQELRAPSHDLEMKKRTVPAA